MSSPFEIYSTSTALLRKFQSSTYHRYACGWDLLSALYLYCLFQKAYGKAIYPATDNPQRIRTGTDVQQLKIDSNGLTASIILRFLYTLPDAFTLRFALS